MTDDFLADLREEHGYISDDERRRAEQMYVDSILAWWESEQP
jgi:hypothetical protein